MKVTNSKSVLLATLAMLALTAPVPAFSQMEGMSGAEHGHMMKMGAMEKMDSMMGSCIEHADKIGLTDAQIKKMKPAHREMQKEQVRFNADVKIEEIELVQLMEIKNFDLEKASSSVKKIADLKTAHQIEMLKMMKEMRSDLTDEQFNKMNKMMAMKGDKGSAKKNMKKHHLQPKESVQ